jgi:TRAP-type C4-dicarboxylate transport system permease small subunit
MQGFSIVLRSFEGVGRITASLLMAALVAITFVDVVGRQFGYPIAFAFEFTKVCVGAMFYVGLPLVTLRREHICVDLVPIRAGAASGIIVAVFVDFLSAGLIALVAKQLWAQAQTLEMFNTVMMFTRWPIAPMVRVMAVLAALTAMICLVQGLSRVFPPRHPRSTGGNT